MDQRRIELQLRLVQAMLRAERRSGDLHALRAFLDRADPIVERAAIAIQSEGDPALAALLRAVRAEMDGVSSP